MVNYERHWKIMKADWKQKPTWRSKTFALVALETTDYLVKKERGYTNRESTFQSALLHRSANREDKWGCNSLGRSERSYARIFVPISIQQGVWSGARPQGPIHTTSGVSYETSPIRILKQWDTQLEQPRTT